jgi:hypothetical protein
VRSNDANELRQRADLVSWLVSWAASYTDLKKGLTPLLDRIGGKPYSQQQISTPKARLPKGRIPSMAAQTVSFHRFLIGYRH